LGLAVDRPLEVDLLGRLALLDEGQRPGRGGEAAAVHAGGVTPQVSW
jgi:hypothetical protein